MNLAKQLLLSKNYWIINKDIVKNIGLEATFLLGILIDGEEQFEPKDGWFFQTTKKIKELSTLTQYKQNKAFNKLEELNFIQKKVKGLPAKRYIKINYNVIEKYFKKIETEKERKNTDNNGKNDKKQKHSKFVDNQPTSSEDTSHNKEHSNKEHTYKEKDIAANPESDKGKQKSESDDDTKNEESDEDKKDLPREYLDLSLKFHKKQKANGLYHPDFNGKLTYDTDVVYNGADEIRKLIKYDGETLNEVKKTLRFGLKDSFWCGKIVSLNNIRTKSKNTGNKKYFTLKNQMITQKPKTYSEAKVNEMLRTDKYEISDFEQLSDGRYRLKE